MHYILFGMGSEPNVYLLPAFIALLLLLLHILFGLEQNEDSVLNQQTCCAEQHMQMKYEIVVFCAVYMCLLIPYVELIGRVRVVISIFK